jgi:hypothetical protein
MWITWLATQRLYRYSSCSDSACKAASSSVDDETGTYETTLFIPVCYTLLTLTPDSFLGFAFAAIAPRPVRTMRKIS